MIRRKRGFSGKWYHKREMNMDVWALRKSEINEFQYRCIRSGDSCTHLESKHIHFEILSEICIILQVKTLENFLKSEWNEQTSHFDMCRLYFVLIDLYVRIIKIISGAIKSSWKFYLIFNLLLRYAYWKHLLYLSFW